MSRKLFEYFFDPEDLEPFYSELMRSNSASKDSDRRLKKRVNRATVSQENKAAEIGDARGPAAAEPVTKSESAAPQVAEDEPVIVAAENQVVGSDERDLQDENREGIAVSSAGTDVRPNSENATTTVGEQREIARSRVRTLLSVHALGQYVFCVRSAILAAERGDERDIDEPPPRLTFLPNFDLERIEEMLSANLRQLVLAAVLIVCLMVSMTLSAIDEGPFQFYLAALAFLFALLWAAHLLICIVQLTLRRMAAMAPKPVNRSPHFRERSR